MLTLLIKVLQLIITFELTLTQIILMTIKIIANTIIVVKVLLYNSLRQVRNIIILATTWFLVVQRSIY